MCGDNWTIREISPSEGYLLDETSYHVGAEATLYTVELNDTSNDVTEQVIKEEFLSSSTRMTEVRQIETPEEGVRVPSVFKECRQLWTAQRTASGIRWCVMRTDMPRNERPALLVIYTVHQTKGWEGREMIGDFDVYISSDGEVYRYLINNRLFESYIKVVKKDAETGNTIPLRELGSRSMTNPGTL